MLFGNEKLAKYDINDFYVGELWMTEKLENLSDKSRLNCQSKLLKKIDLIIKGTVDLQVSDNIRSNPDFSEKVKHHKVLTIFYKYNGNYLCLHDGNVYRINESDFGSNLVQLFTILPKVGYNIPKMISIPQALLMFEQLFNKSISLESIYSSDKYDINNFYTGTLSLYTEFLPHGQGKEATQINTMSTVILAKNSVKTGSFINSVSIKVEPSLQEKVLAGKYKYINYECLFLEMSDGMYNVNDFQIYEKGLIEEGFVRNTLIGESYYKNIKPITEQCADLKGTKISIPKLLKKTKRS